MFRLTVPQQRPAIRLHAGKGFGSKEQSPDRNEKGTATKTRKKKLQQRDVNPIQPMGPSPNSREEKFLQRLEKVKDGSDVEDQAFQKRLESLKQKAQVSQKRREESSQAGPLSSGPLEAPKRESKSEEGSSPTGVPQVAIGILSLLLVGVFVVTSGYGPGGVSSPPQSQSQASQSQLEAQKAVQERVTALEEELQAKPDDAEIKMDLSDLVTVSGDYKRARSLAEQIVKAEPQNSKAWLILGECRTRLLDLKGAVTAYQKSLETTSQPSLQQLQGLTGALANDKKQEEAIQQLQKYVPQAGKSEALSAIDLQLLIGKVYSQWDRHFASALAVYDGIIEKYPEDFRGYLAKGALFKENGRKADAQRMFIQARFYAPAEARAIVEQIANR